MSAPSATVPTTTVDSTSNPYHSMPSNAISAIVSWATSGCPCTSKTILQRPSAVSYPNTFVIMWFGVSLGTYGTVPYVALDVHYQGGSIQAGKPLQALGGMWVKGINGAMKPEQDSNIRSSLTAQVPATSPEPTGMKKFGSY